MPRISIIIPTFNCAQFLGRAVDSIFLQTYKDYEIIIVDDGSTDWTRELVERWTGRVKYFYWTNHGVSATRNFAISKSNGELLAYLDADDMWYPERLEHQVAFLDAHPECGFVHSDVTIIDENNQIVLKAFNRETQRSVPEGFCIMELLHHCHVQLPTVLERRSCYDSTKGFNELLRFAEDYLHWIEVLLNGYAIGYIDKPLAYYRRRIGSASNNELKMAEGIIKMLTILIEDHIIPKHLGKDACEKVRCRIKLIQRSLPYLCRVQGQADVAIRKSVELILMAPTEYTSYLELLKSFIPRGLSRKIHKLLDL